MFTFSEALMEICILIILTFALLAWCIGATVRSCQASHSESGSLKDEEFGLLSKIKKFFPKESLESESEKVYHVTVSFQHTDPAVFLAHIDDLIGLRQN